MRAGGVAPPSGKENLQRVVAVQREKDFANATDMPVDPFDDAAAIVNGAGNRQGAIAMNEVDLHIDQHKRDAGIVKFGGR